MTERRCPLTGKVRYDNEAIAKAALDLIQARSTRRVVPCRAYGCVLCGGWHLTHKPSWREVDPECESA